jgi:hypothetical protein
MTAPSTWSAQACRRSGEDAEGVGLLAGSTYSRASETTGGSRDQAWRGTLLLLAAKRAESDRRGREAEKRRRWKGVGELG